ncbi:MAG: energy coupling factor transporter S component ThiW [Thaumarchaeota archaeon]|nr:energy coupling factor transporter S component ThiW [Candidatus Calditenuaceae archaeon]MDW8187086.1 energy coupling factor transporter S component ThiW [Nitrososphaerota archaeon]
MAVRATRTVALWVVLSAMGIALAPIFWFPFLGTRAYPGQHMVNVLAGVMLGPLSSTVVPLIVGTVRIALGLGTIFAYPGGIPGALMVGIFHRYLTSRFRRHVFRYLSALAEPIGTVLIGGTISLLLLAPLIGSGPLLALLNERGALGALPVFWSGWAVSSVPGSVLGYVLCLALNRALPERALEWKR